ncbi:amidohydrolase [Shinella sp.]|uniref:amidohydrolase n=1 Tax=Shinella sp. TaxID=1870904 RepID=UPI003F717B91
MFLTEQDLLELVQFRHELHRHPEISSEERETAQRVVSFLAPLKPDRIVTALGRTGVAVVFDSGQPGPTLLFRCELDALPIAETSDIAHRSLVPGKGHMCGHDGHMTVLSGLARGLSRQRPARGRVVLLFQPAEETGAGALAVLEDPAFEHIRPDLSFSLHNIPGMELGYVALTEGPVNCASRGMRIRLSGRTAHASTPRSGRSPMAAVAALMPALAALTSDGTMGPDFAMVTVTHAALGEPTFGVAPGSAEVWATLRTLTDDSMERLRAQAEALAERIAAAEGLELAIDYDDIFPHCENSPEAVAYLSQALAGEGVPFDRGDLPMLGSEDFGRFRTVAPAAMFFLGAGPACPALHSPDYDFPDDLIEVGARIFMRVVRDMLG